MELVDLWESRNGDDATVDAMLVAMGQITECAAIKHRIQKEC